MGVTSCNTGTRVATLPGMGGWGYMGTGVLGIAGAKPQGLSAAMAREH